MKYKKHEKDFLKSVKKNVKIVVKFENYIAVYFNPVYKVSEKIYSSQSKIDEYVNKLKDLISENQKKYDYLCSEIKRLGGRL